MAVAVFGPWVCFARVPFLRVTSRKTERPAEAVASWAVWCGTLLITEANLLDLNLWTTWDP